MHRGAYKYHAFLSHNGADKDWTRRLAEALRGHGLSIFFDEDTIDLGEDISTAIEAGLRQSRHVVLVLSPTAVASAWVALEYTTSLHKDPGAKARVLIPILRADCDIPLTLARLKHLDARSNDFDGQVTRLLRAIDRDAVGGAPEPVAVPAPAASAPAIAPAPARKVQRFSLGRPVLAHPECLYVERLADRKAREIVETGGLMIVSGARMVGKTSLFNRVRAHATGLGKKVAFVDLQAFGSRTSVPQMYFAICRAIGDSLNCPRPSADVFNADPVHELNNFLRALPDQSVVVFDEFDMLSEIGAIEDFAMIVRAWQSALAHSPSTISVLIGGYQPPYMWIDRERDVSTANLGSHVRLNPFTPDESELLIKEGLPSLPPEDRASLHALTGGHPMLLQHAMDWIHSGHPVQDLYRDAAYFDGPFGHYLAFLPPLDEAVRRKLEKDGLKGLTWQMGERLELMGLVRRTRANTFEWLGELHRSVFERAAQDESA